MIERDCFEMFELLRIWSISQYLAAPFSHCKAMIDNMVHNSGPYFIWYAPLSLAYSVSSSVLPLYTSTMYTPLLPLPLFCLCTLPPCTLLFFLFLCLPLYTSTMYTPLLPLPLFCLCTLPPCTLLFFLFLCFASVHFHHVHSSSSSRLLTLIVFWMFIHCQNL